MEHAVDRLQALGIGVPDILLPKSATNLTTWAVVACDQYTSEQSYWKDVEKYVGNNPSTLHMIFPEAFLDEPEPQNRIDRINSTMARYVHEELFTTYGKCFFLVHRQTGSGPGRWGLIAALDLEQYDYAVNSRTMIRATEGTIISRIPPRKMIRKDALLELPHIVVLINDPKRTVIEPLVAMKGAMKRVYDTDLMKLGGHVAAYHVTGERLLDRIATAFEGLYAALDPSNPLLFAMGDGNHSLATAKSCWEDIKRTLPEHERGSHPARYALVEIENIFDEGLVFKPIHRVLFEVGRQAFLDELTKHCASYRVEESATLDRVLESIGLTGGPQRFGYIDPDGLKIISLTEPKATIPAGTLQAVIDSLVDRKTGTRVDYIHGADVTASLGSQKGNIGLFLPAIDKQAFFDTIVRDGVLPRKTFSMGEAHEKRFYMEARRIR